jgi:hypothetical protein
MLQGNERLIHANHGLTLISLYVEVASFERILIEKFRAPNMRNNRSKEKVIGCQGMEVGMECYR